jgi:hypothetical protein
MASLAACHLHLGVGKQQRRRTGCERKSQRQAAGGFVAAVRPALSCTGPADPPALHTCSVSRLPVLLNAGRAARACVNLQGQWGLGGTGWRFHRATQACTNLVAFPGRL